MKSLKYVSPILDRIRKEDPSQGLELAHQMALNYVKGIDDRPVFPDQKSIDGLKAFDENLDVEPQNTADILSQLDTYGSPATVAQTGGRYFGFVCGGILPSALASKWLTDAWDQNPAMYVMSPVASKIETVTERWVRELMKLPEETAAGYVSGSSTATIIGLATGRNFLLNNLGYDVGAKGLLDAPPIKVVIGAGAHSTVYKALSVIGMGSARVTSVPVDDQGRIREDLMPEMDDRTLVVLQAGNVNSGAFDPFENICLKAREAGAYVHIDGAFGLWAAANDRFSDLTRGMELADSWSVDGHKTLNTPYDSGIILCRHRQAMIKTLHMTGSYIVLSEERDSMLYTTEMSRRARAIDLWATLKGLGSKGVSELVWELHSKAGYFAELLEAGGLEVLNKVVFNQVMVRFKTDELTEQLIDRIQKSGVCWLGGSKWEGNTVIRISVSSYMTTYEDIEMSAKDILAQARFLETES